MPLPLFEVIVSTPVRPKLLAIPRGLRVTWVETGQLFPPGKMRNIGAAQAHSETLLFLDDDCIPPPEWNQAMQQTLKNMAGVAAVGCRVISLEADFWGRCADFVLFSSAQQLYSCHRHLGCASLAVRASVFRQAGGFDLSLLASEDWDFGLRLEDIGWRSYFTADITVLHDHHRGHFKDIMRQAYRSGWLSGLTVQQVHHPRLGLSARLATRLAESWIYPLFGLPYAVLLTILHAWEMRSVDRRWPAFVPFLAASRFLYQLGVWARLRHDRSPPSGTPLP